MKNSFGYILSQNCLDRVLPSQLFTRWRLFTHPVPSSAVQLSLIILEQVFRFHNASEIRRMLGNERPIPRLLQTEFACILLYYNNKNRGSFHIPAGQSVFQELCAFDLE